MTAKEQLERAAQIFDIEIEGLRAVRDSLGETFVRAAELLSSTVAAGGIVVVSGVGKSLHVAEKMSGILSSTGTRSVVLNPVQAMHGDLGMVSSRDVLVALSFSGESEEVVRLIPAIRRHGLKVVSLTGNAGSTLAKLSDVHVSIPCGKEACPFGMAPTNSATATMVMGDALAMVLVDMQKFAIENYAMNHPAGAIGRALVMRVTDVMRTGERLAVVSPSATVMETVLAMTKAQTGAAVVADDSGRLLGIFTDGDFRRAVSRSETALQTLERAAVSEFMTEKPLFVRDDAYAAELLKIFERRRIDDLPVCDGSGRVVGMVDIQDLPKMKVL
jgi:arabinose-5-phosphate isomerase